MENFNSHQFHSSLVSEFQKMDEILESFRNQFNREVLSIVGNTFLENVSQEEFEELVLTYANQIFNTAESVCDKDKNYSDIKLADEVGIMNKMVGKMLEENNENRELADRIHQKAKELMVNFNPDLMDLSADGFRLLEKYSLMYNIFFISNFSAPQ